MPALLKKKSIWILLVLACAIAVFWLSRPAPTPPRGSGKLMNAIVYHEYGPPDVLHLERIEKLLPDDHQVSIKVAAASANPLDWHFMRGKPYLVRVVETGLLKPKSGRLGVDVAGWVEAVGKNVTQFKPGDEVFGTAGGAFAEYARTSEKSVVLKPANLTFEQAAAVPVAAVTALQGLRDKGRIRPGQHVLINGASGGVGTFAVQLARLYGAHVTGVCSTRNVQMVRSLGAEQVVDYTRQDFTTGPQRYDVILDNVGNRSLADFRRVMQPRGIYVLIGGGGPDEDPWLGPLGDWLKTLVLSPFVSQEFTTLLASINQRDLMLLKKLMAEEKVTPVIDRTYPLNETPEAIRYLERGHARGKVVITVAPGH